MGKEFSHYERTPSTWTLAKDDLSGQLEAAHSTVGVNGSLPHWLRRLRDNDAQVVFTLRAGAVEVFGHSARKFDKRRSTPGPPFSLLALIKVC